VVPILDEAGSCRAPMALSAGPSDVEFFLPGWQAEHGEQPCRCAVRELFEETRPIPRAEGARAGILHNASDTRTKASSLVRAQAHIAQAAARRGESSMSAAPRSSSSTRFVKRRSTTPRPCRYAVVAKLARALALTWRRGVNAGRDDASMEGLNLIAPTQSVRGWVASTTSPGAGRARSCCLPDVYRLPAISRLPGARA